LHGFKTQVHAQGTGLVRIWTEYVQVTDALHPSVILGAPQTVASTATQAQIDAAKQAARDSLKANMREMALRAPDFLPGVTQGMNGPTNWHNDNPDNYKAGFKVEINGVAAAPANFEMTESTDPTTGAITFRYKMKVPVGATVKIWIRLPK
jgi:hypothetical protein